jgi:4-hydroxy-3-methylbut-2-enyl diphosphate reductase
VTGSLSHGDVVEGKVVNVVDFGAFVELDDGVEGLVHSSEMPEGMGLSADLLPGSSVLVRVLRIDVHRHRISLSMRGLGQSPTLPLDHAGW